MLRGGFMLGFLKRGVANEDLALLAPESGLGCYQFAGEEGGLS